MKTEEQLIAEAKHLARAAKYFKWTGPGRISALAGWRRHGNCCVYCDKDFTKDWEAMFDSHTDHLLPRSYNEILWDPRNLVRGCWPCNTLKNDYDANRELPEDKLPEDGGRYTSGPHLTRRQHEELLSVCRIEVAKRRERQRAIMEEALSAWNSLPPSVSPPPSMALDEVQPPAPLPMLPIADLLAPISELQEVTLADTAKGADENGLDVESPETGPRGAAPPGAGTAAVTP